MHFLYAYTHSIGMQTDQTNNLQKIVSFRYAKIYQVLFLLCEKNCVSPCCSKETNTITSHVISPLRPTPPPSPPPTPHTLVQPPSWQLMKCPPFVFHHSLQPYSTLVSVPFHGFVVAEAMCVKDFAWTAIALLARVMTLHHFRYRSSISASSYQLATETHCRQPWSSSRPRAFVFSVCSIVDNGRCIGYLYFVRAGRSFCEVLNHSFSLLFVMCAV